MDDEIEALFAESLELKVAGDGIGIRFADGPEFVVWWSRVAPVNWPTIRAVIGCSANTLRLNVTGEFEIEQLAQLISLARLQAKGYDPDGINLAAVLAYVEHQVWDLGNPPISRRLRVDDGLNRNDDGAVLVGVDDAAAGPES